MIHGNIYSFTHILSHNINYLHTQRHKHPHTHTHTHTHTIKLQIAFQLKVRIIEKLHLCVCVCARACLEYRRRAKWIREEMENIKDTKQTHRQTCVQTDKKAQTQLRQGFEDRAISSIAILASPERRRGVGPRFSISRHG